MSDDDFDDIASHFSDSFAAFEREVVDERLAESVHASSDALRDRGYVSRAEIEVLSERMRESRMVWESTYDGDYRRHQEMLDGIQATNAKAIDHRARRASAAIRGHDRALEDPHDLPRVVDWVTAHRLVYGFDPLTLELCD